MCTHVDVCSYACVRRCVRVWAGMCLSQECTHSYVYRKYLVWVAITVTKITVTVKSLTLSFKTKQA